MSAGLRKREPGGSIAPKVAYISDKKASGTSGGSCIAGGYQNRSLNTLVDPDGIVVSLSLGDSFTLREGTYEIEASAPAYKSAVHKIKLRDTTTPLNVIWGTSEYSSPAYNGHSRSFLKGRFTIVTNKTFQIQHYTGSSFVTEGLGVASSIGDIETYTEIKITKIS